jgi:predicted DsbA family dithiol-disulfide isomerase
LKVEIWSDIICPFCYIGKRRFESGLEQFANKETVEIVYRSFQLDPDAERDTDQDAYDSLASKKGMSREQSIAMHAQVAKQATEVGLSYHFDTAIPTNTFDAHRLMHFAAQYGKREVIAELLFKAYFTEAKHIGSPEALEAIAEEAGLDPNEAGAMLASEQFGDEVRTDIQVANELGIRGVPFYVINNKYAISGAQPSELFLQTLEKAWSEEQPLILINSNSDSQNNGDGDPLCADGVCAVEEK